MSQLKARRESLKAQLEDKRQKADAKKAADDAAHDALTGPIELTESIRELSKELSDMEEKAILYRTTGWTCFEMDLDVGRRERAARKSQAGGDPHMGEKSGLGLGVRLETFWRGMLLPLS